MKIIEAELWNFRCHTHYLFQPKAEGVTALVGANGAGKSSIVDGIAWCLYGVKPTEVKRNRQLIRDGFTVSKKDKAGVRVRVEDRGEQLEVERLFVSKTGSVECTVSLVQDDGSLKELAGPAVSHSERFLTQRLQLDAASFLTASFVQQKQVDALIFAKDKSKVIEDLTGITAITLGLKEAREELNLQKRLLASYSFDEGEFEGLNEKIAELKGAYKREKESFDTLKSKVVHARDVAEGKKSAYDAASVELSTYDRAQELIANSPLHGLTARKSALLEEIASLKKVVSCFTVSKAEAEKEFNLRQAEREATATMFNKVMKDLAEIAEIRRVLNGLPSLSDCFDTIMLNEEALRKAKLSLNEALDSETQAKADNQQWGKSLNLLTSSDHQCPTCLQPIDDPTSLHATLLEGKSKADEALRQATVKRAEAEKAVNEAENTLTESTAQHERVKDLLDKMSGEAALVERREALEVELAERRALLQSASSVMSKAAVAESERARLNKLTEEARKVMVELKAVEVDLSDARSVKKPTKGREQVEKLYRELQAAQKKAEELTLDYTEKRSSSLILVSELKAAQEKFTQLEAERERFTDALKRQEQLTQAVSDLSRFKKERIDTSTDAIVLYASDFVSRFTGGKMTGVKLDDSFNASAVVGGRIREVGELSGGEMSAVSMAIRLAIAKALSSENFIILDEVFVSQDRERSDFMISSIKESFGGQVIVISHTNSLGDMSDESVAV